MSVFWHLKKGTTQKSKSILKTARQQIFSSVFTFDDPKDPKD